MTNDVYVKQCGQCRETVYGIMTSSFDTTMTILFECQSCGHVWSEDKHLTGAENKAVSSDAVPET